jgi:microcystin-dependent protein
VGGIGYCHALELPVLQTRCTANAAAHEVSAGNARPIRFLARKPKNKNLSGPVPGVVCAAKTTEREATIMANPYLGEIRMVGFNFAPIGWAFTNGQLLPIQQDTALFSLLGTTYGGNGQTTFALPNLQSRMPMHMGQGVGPLSSRSIGQTGGAETATFPPASIPSVPVAPIQALASVASPVESISPYLAVSFIIALQGIFPSRN